MTAEESESRERGFKVQDRRRFSAEGEVRAEAGESGGAAANPSEAATEASAPPAGEQHPSAEEAALEPTFAAFIWSLSEQALAALGEMPDPATGLVKRDLPVAQQMIDIIRMLRDKTRGNLDRDEQAMIAEILSTLQIKYVELARIAGR
ncbi:MAG: DUF1844 domain-containing protein [Candidatus Binataceae bacterium]